jgi:transposase
MIPSGARVWIAMGHTDMRKGMQGLALIVQQALCRDPFAGVPRPRRIAGEDRLA